MAAENFIYINRDLSWLSFNQRVLEEAADPSVPLYSRINFLSIFSSNLDEFFRVRMPSIFAFTSIPAKKTSLREEYPQDLLQRVQSIILEQQEKFGEIFTQQIIPALRQNHVQLYYGDVINFFHLETIREYFLSKVLSFIQPVFLRKDQPPVFLENNALYFLVDVENAGDRPGTHSYAILNIPSDHLPRFMELPKIGDDHFILFLDDAIRQNLQEIFPGFIIHGVYSIKVTRDAELELADEFTGDIAEKIEKQLSKRELGHSTRFLYESGMPAEIIQFARGYFSLREGEMIEGGRYHNLKDLISLPNPLKSLTYEPWPPVPHKAFNNHVPVFRTIADKERLLHLPYHSYNYILRFFNEAAIDPQVKEIYVTLYRVAADSHIVNALISAAKNGKKVVVFVELKARFDEANNLRWSKKMKAAGVKIINSIPALKVHAKIAMVKRYEDGWKNYSFMATGNFNESTAKYYTDHVFYTADRGISQELEDLFGYLQSRKQPQEYRKIPFKHLLVSHFNMIKRFRKLIEREIRHVRSGRAGRIVIKINNLQEREMINLLYEASNAGVKIDLIVRSICCLAPGIRGQSENITVHRIVDRYLEHARIFVFYNDGQPEYFMGSADWMNRNLHSRIEVVFPLYDKLLCEQIENILQIQLRDNTKAVMLKTDLEDQSIINLKKFSNGPPVAAQQAIYHYVKTLEE